MDFIKMFLNGVGYFFVIYLLGYSTFLFLSVVVGANRLFNSEKKQMLKNELVHDYYMPISIIVPAFNEEVTIIDTIKSLLSLDYKLYEIIIVDDGSKDETSKKLIEHFNLYKINKPIKRSIKCTMENEIYESQDFKVPITLICKENAGKADALNMGINVSKYPYFICIDADSMLQVDALKKIIAPVLEDEKIIAAGGMIQISNDIEFKDSSVLNYKMPKSILASMQVLEYERSFLASRILLDTFNGNLIVSGAFGLFKKSIAIAAGGYDTNTIGEDMELIVKLHVFCRLNKIPYKIAYVEEAICWTQAPEKLSSLIKQRRRWHIGLLQSLRKYKRIFFNIQYGLVSFISYLYFLIYELLSPFIEVFGLITIALAVYVDLINIPFMILFLLIYILFGSFLTITSFFTRTYIQKIKISFKDFFKAILLCGFENSILRFILAVVRMAAFFHKNKRMTWDKFERTENKV